MNSKETVWNVSFKTVWHRTNWKQKLSALILGAVPSALLVLAAVRYNVPVPSEYAIGILGGNGILIGFWGVIIGISRKDNKALWKHKIAIMHGLFFSLALLIFSVFLLYLNALEFISSIAALSAAMMSFYMTIVFLAITLYYGIFAD